MGVKDLMNLLKVKCPSVLYTAAAKPVEGDFWVDTPLIVMAAVKKAEVQHENPIPIAKLSLNRIFKQIKGIRNEAKVHWVFDGGSREEKKETRLQRSKATEAFTKRCFDKRLQVVETGFEVDSSIDADLDVASAIVSEAEPQVSLKEVYDYVKQYALTLGTVHLAKHDSEEFIARNMGPDDVAVSSDSDALPFGCYTVIQHFGSDKETWVYIDDVLDALQLSMEEFQTLCVLLGTDFNPRLKGCGPVKCFSSIQEENFSLEQYCMSNGGNQLWLEQANLALKVFRGE